MMIMNTSQTVYKHTYYTGLNPPSMDILYLQLYFPENSYACQNMVCDNRERKSMFDRNLQYTFCCLEKARGLKYMHVGNMIRCVGTALNAMIRVLVCVCVCVCVCFGVAGTG